MEFEKTRENTIKRGSKKARYDEDTIYKILDATSVCFIAFNIDGKAFTQPVNYGRKGNKIFIHGSHNNRMTTAILSSEEVCLSVMILDAMKLTRSAYHHSVNFRSVVVFGTVRELFEHEEKLEGLKALINHFVPGRWDHCRIPNESEIKATRVIEINIDSASAKVADAPAKEESPDYELDYWAGTIPVRTLYGPPIRDCKLNPEIETPKHILDFIHLNV